MEKVAKYYQVVIVFVIGIVFVIQSLSFYDPDFWWHIKVGELIRNNGILRADPFSYTMPSFAVVSHEWSIDILLHFLFVHNLYGVLAIIFSLLALVSVALSLKSSVFVIKTPKMVRPFEFSMGILVSSVLVGYMGIRPQVLSWVFFAGLLFCLYWIRNKKKERYLFLLSLGFLVWANVHGSFVAGLVTFVLFSIGLLWRIRRIQWSWIIAPLLSMAVTIINPYGIGVWREVLSSVFDRDLRWRIQEWQPSVMTFNLSFICFVAFVLAVGYRYRAKIFLEEKLLIAFFLLQAISSTRHVPLWVIIAAPVLVRGGIYLYQEVMHERVAVARLRKVSNGSVIVFFFIFIYSAAISMYKFSRISQVNYFPTHAVEFLQHNTPKGNLFSEYAWGGYLIWNYPEKKVFIDGRMPSWRQSNSPANESSKAMDDYIDLITGRLHHKKTFEKYQIDTVLWPKNKIVTEPAQLSLIDVIQMRLSGVAPYHFDLITDLERNAWVKTYEDSLSVIYKKSVE